MLFVSILGAAMVALSPPPETRLEGAIVRARLGPSNTGSVIEIIQQIDHDFGFTVLPVNAAEFIKNSARFDPNAGIRVGIDSPKGKGVKSLKVDVNAPILPAKDEFEIWAQFLGLERLTIACIAGERPLNDKVAQRIDTAPWPEKMQIGRFRLLGTMKRQGCLSKQAENNIVAPRSAQLLGRAGLAATPPGTLNVILYELVRAGYPPPAALIDKMMRYQDPDGGWFDPEDKSVYPTLAGVYLLSREVKAKGKDPAAVAGGVVMQMPFLPISEFKHRPDSPRSSGGPPPLP